MKWFSPYLPDKIKKSVFFYAETLIPPELRTEARFTNELSQSKIKRRRIRTYSHEIEIKFAVQSNGMTNLFLILIHVSFPIISNFTSIYVLKYILYHHLTYFHSQNNKHIS